MSSKVQEALRRWANWAGGRVGTELYSVSPGFQGAVKWRSMDTLSDDEGEVIDSAVGLLKRYDRESYELIRDAYLKRHNGGTLAQARGTSRSGIYPQLRQAEAFIAGVLASHCRAVEIREQRPA